MRALGLALSLLLLGCTDPAPAAPRPAPSEPQAGVFRPLDGEWTGTFRVYRDARGQQPGGPPAGVDPAVLQAAPYVVDLELKVHQRYVSESDVLQRVTITDTYPDGKVEVSQGVNEVEAGQLLCTVNKPSDTVVHTGTLPAPDTILWQRSRKQPQAIEWFRETVASDTYSIVGYGYYPGDDPKKTPRLFFHAVYTRPAE